MVASSRGFQKYLEQCCGRGGADTEVVLMVSGSDGRVSDTLLGGKELDW
jgi:hypothetical protein